MRIGRNKAGGAGHIKKHTQGTSNEISFSVLDSMKGADEEDDGVSPLGRISLFTLGPKRPASTPSKDPSLPEKYTRSAHGRSGKTSSSSWRTTDREVKERRKHRKRSKRLIVLFVALLCAVGLVFLGIIGVGRFQQMQERTQHVEAQIEEVRQQYESVEPLFTLVETTLQTPLADIDAAALDQQVSEWESKQQSISTKLRATKTSLERLEEQLSGSNAERANDAIGAVNATMRAVESGHAVLSEVAAAAQAHAQAQAFMDDAMAGDSHAREAAAESLTDEASAQAAIEASRAAISEFEAARSAVQEVAAEATGLIEASGLFDQSAADLMQPFIDYIDLRIQAQEHAIEADEGYLDVSSQRIAEANAQYNAAEEEAAELIAGLRGAYPADIVQRAYEAVMPTDENVITWETERARAQQLLS